MRLAFFASHNGSAAHAITKACDKEELNADPVFLISNNADSGALKWAVEDKVKAYCLNEKNMGGADKLDEEIANLINDHKIDLGICSGYMRLIGPQTISACPILNVHPALLPKYGGKGMYGKFVHRAVKENGDTQTGITIHLVDSEYDQGPVVAQKTLPVKPEDSAEDIENRVKAAEPDFYIETLRKIISGEIKLP